MNYCFAGHLVHLLDITLIPGISDSFIGVFMSLLFLLDLLDM